MKLVVGIAAVAALASSPLCAKPRPALPDTPNMAEWRDVGQSMAELVEQGYSLVTAIATGDQDEVTVYFLSKGTELIRCRDGISSLTIAASLRVAQSWFAPIRPRSNALIESSANVQNISKYSRCSQSVTSDMKRATSASLILSMYSTNGLPSSCA